MKNNSAAQKAKRTGASQTIVNAYRILAHVGVQIDALRTEFFRILDKKAMADTEYQFDIHEARDSSEDDPSGYVCRSHIQNFGIKMKIKSEKGKKMKLEIMLAVQTVLAPVSSEDDDGFLPYLVFLTSRYNEGDWNIGDFEWERDQDKLSKPDSGECRYGNAINGFDHYFECYRMPLEKIASVKEIEELADQALRMIKHTFKQDEQ